MELTEKLALERRARLAAERLLEKRTRELFAANEKLALHARSLSDQIVEQREVVRHAKDEAATLKGERRRVLSDLERAHSAAVMAERRLWESIDTFRDGFAVFDSSLMLVTGNRAFSRSFGDLRLEPGVSYGQLLHEVVRRGLVEPGGLGPQAWIREMNERLDQDPIPDRVVKLSNGSWIRLTDRRAQDGDLVCQAINITEQMRIWAAIEAIPDGFVLFDREDRLVICNQSYRDIYKTSAPIIAPGVSFEEILRHGLSMGEYPEAGGREEDWLAERMAQHRSPSSEGEQQLSGGRWLRTIDKETPDGGRVGLRVDITQLRAQAAALEAARQAAEAANRAKSAFLANMSHEIRTPMNGVVGMAELLCDTALSDEQRLFAETIRSSGEALLVIINDILDYSKIEAERLTLHPEAFDLERVIHEVTMLLQPRAQARGLDLMIDYDVFLPTRYIGDPGRLRQVLTNLIGNAVKFTETGHVLTRVVGLEVEDGRHQLHVTVEDTGIGIPPEHLDHIFGEFNQVEDEQNRKYEGTGLGLAITRRLIERMEGAVWVDSEPGKGSVFGFRVTLPVAESAEAPRLPVTITTAMVVDDQFINRTILERQLTSCGIEVALCRSGAEALALIEDGARPDVVLTDHDMPGMDGLTLALKLREAGYDQPVVLLSSNPAAARESEGAAAIDVILQKPLLRADLYRQLQTLTLPVATAVEEPPPAPAEAELRPMRVLAAEDNKTNQLVFQKMVRSMDIELRFAADGREALAAWRDFRPDLIFMDISMPEMDGKQAASAIRTAEAAEGLPRVPILALTAHAMDGDSGGILAAGIDRHLTKPLRRSEICAALAEYQPAACRPADPGTSDAA
ncbi:hybrid sensor histidine kinase/response regulator [Pseudogemmobacter humi]|uniref:Sensory/regulatory protein RpfC n=1 Tax=Pseudogemmobacter humi TaxID=2483812 RepID=A0A3P5WZD0_9RHOB|nr:response regulator [Pseudogemmobacter humi]VDC27279.1 Signal transduction histidine-protein kinase BarA [Pseudogemmobacter humi]